jgi:gliding motility-associated lipoprotein GldD
MKKIFFFIQQILPGFILLITSCWFIISCNATYTSKKRGYYKIDFPERKYIVFDKPGYPYSFEYPAYAQVVRDTTYFDSNPENPYWINIDFPQFGGRIFLSYKIIGGKAPYKIKQADGSYKDSAGINVFDRMVDDAFKLTNKNESIASSIKDSLIQTPNGVSGVFFRVGGNAATARQFFLSDTTKNFFRGALYFDVTPNADSLRPVLDFLQKDIDHLINSFKWTPPGNTQATIASPPLQ